MGKKSKPQVVDKNNRLIATNRRARHDFSVEETFEAGLVLEGSEVKSIRAGRVSLGEAFIDAWKGELFLEGMHVAEYPWAHARNHEPRRTRKLLLHRRELDRITGRIHQRGYTGVPLKIYLKDGRVKALIGLAKGKRKVDRRRELKEREQKREMDRAMKRH